MPASLLPLDCVAVAALPSPGPAHVTGLELAPEIVKHRIENSSAALLESSTHRLHFCVIECWFLKQQCNKRIVMAVWCSVIKHILTNRNDSINSFKFYYRKRKGIFKVGIFPFRGGGLIYYLFYISWHLWYVCCFWVLSVVYIITKSLIQWASTVIKHKDRRACVEPSCNILVVTLSVSIYGLFDPCTLTCIR